jgi:ubiquinone/menaquinone biosynthesis C-methylase UbiE
MSSAISATEATRRRYDRVAPFYDLMGAMPERRMRRWRRDLWALVEGRDVLEVGVGTGRGIEFYPAGAEVTAIDISERMLAHARQRAELLGTHVRLLLADAQCLPFGDAEFDTAIATFVFCSVPDPVQGLRELRRVLRPGGRLLLVEHVLSERPALRRWMRRLDGVTSRVWGAHIARETVANVRAAGFAEVRDTDLSLDVVKRITARAPA